MTGMDERRPGWIQDLPPDERWRHEQANAWEWALYVRSDQYSYGLSACLEQLLCRVLANVRRSAWWAWCKSAGDPWPVIVRHNPAGVRDLALGAAVRARDH